MTNDRTCLVCQGPLTLYREGTTDGQTYFNRGTSYGIAGGDYQSKLPIFRCAVCGHGMTAWEVDSSIITAWYGRHELDTVFLADEAGRRKTARQVVRRLATMFPRPGRILDVGAGPGLFLSEAARAGWQVDGIEPAAASREYASRHWHIRLRSGGSEILRSLPEGTYDVVTAFDVLEHVTDPGATLRDMARLLRPAGWLVLTTPKFDSALSRLLGRRWYALFPAHLHYFTKQSLGRCLAEAGFTIVTARTHIRYLSLSYVGQRLWNWLRRRNSSSASQRGVLSRFNVPVFLGDEFEIYARKAH